MPRIEWNGLGQIGSMSYTCGFCGRHTGPDRGYYGAVDERGRRFTSKIYICTFCRQPTYFPPNGDPVPGPVVGNEIRHVPESIAGLYEESRRCLTANAPTAAVMAARKVLMNLAVAEGADPDLSFLEYVDWLQDKGYVPPGGRGWVDPIRKIGNAANHEIPSVSTATAGQVLVFTEGLLRFVYELPGDAARLSVADADAPATAPDQ